MHRCRSTRPATTAATAPRGSDRSTDEGSESGSTRSLSAPIEERKTTGQAEPPGEDRRILVVGTDLAAVATAGYLTRAGFDPVLASTTRTRPAPTVTVIWESGLVLLERLDLREPVVRHGRRLTHLDRLDTGMSWHDDTGGDPSLVAIQRSQLSHLLTQRVEEHVRTPDRAVTALQSVPSGVRATFETGVVEPFDVAVTADRSLLPCRESVTDGGIHTWQFESMTPSTGAQEAFDDTRAVFVVPRSEGAQITLVTTADTTPAAAVSPASIADRFASLVPSMPALSRTLAGGFEYRRGRLATPVALSHGHIGFVGTAARPALPGSHLGAAMDLESAWTVADAIASAPAPVTETLASYERRRRRRVTRLWDQVSDPHATGSWTPLRLVVRARRLAFSHLIDGSDPSIARDVPETL